MKCAKNIFDELGENSPASYAIRFAACFEGIDMVLSGMSSLQPENIKDTLHAYQMAKRCNEKRVMYEAVKWGERGARINSISPGIIVTPHAIDEFNGVRGEFYKNMFAKVLYIKKWNDALH